MGGKSQQRVAGNVKPANSRRVRELLMNKQHNFSNIITFSALSNANNSNQASSIESESKTDNQVEKNKHTRNEPKVESILKPQASPVVGEKPKLIVKKIAGRDCFSRVTFSEDTNLPSEDVPQKCGVFLPPTEPIENLSKPEEEKISQLETDGAVYDAVSHDDADSDSSDDSCHYDEREENYLDFDDFMDKLEDFKEYSRSTRASSTPLTELEDDLVDREITVSKMFRYMIKNFCSEISILEWDMAMGRLERWVKWSVQIFSGDSSSIRDKHIELLTRALMLLNELVLFAKSVEIRRKSEENLDYLPMFLLEEWNWHLFEKESFKSMIALFFKVVKTISTTNEERAKNIKPLLRVLARVIVSIDDKSLFSNIEISNQLGIDADLDSGYKLPANSVLCELDCRKFSHFIGICRHLSSNDRVALIVAHSVLKKLMKDVSKDSASASILSDDLNTVEDVPIFPPRILMATLTSRDSIMTVLLSDFKESDSSVTIEPKSDSYACTLSYLFIWDLIIDYIAEAPKEVSCRIIHSLKRLGLIQRLLDHIVMLFPPLTERNPLHLKFKKRKNKVGMKSEYPEDDWSLTEYLKEPLRNHITRPINEIELIAIHLYFSMSRLMPVTVRKWYNNSANKRLCNLANEYTVKYISPIICTMEMNFVQAKCKERTSSTELNNLVIKARPSAKEVYTIYIRDEFKMELTIKLPNNYPLGPMQIDGGKRVGVTDVKWRSWLLQLTTFLSQQNGPILDGIDLWRKNIDKRFEGVEKCTICFSILHSNYQLPKKRCQTCANMFHNMCLYKWFESSGNSTCPLCRNPW